MNDGRRLVALICEDDTELSAALELNLRDIYGFHVAATATSLVDALAATSRDAPDVVVVDLALTGAHGVGVVAAFRDAAPGTRVVLLAPPGFEELGAEAVAAGAVTVVATDDLRALQCTVERIAMVHGDDCAACAARGAERYWGRG